MGDLVNIHGNGDESPVPVGHVLKDEFDRLWSAVQDAKGSTTIGEKRPDEPPVRSHAVVRSEFPAFVDASLDAPPINAQHAEIIQHVRDWVDGRGPCWLTIGGTRGTGKTWLACAAANALFQARRPVVICKFSDMIRLVQQADKSGEYRGISGAVAARLTRRAILDDVGASSKTSYAAEMIEEILDWSYRQRTRLLLTTNLDSGELATYLDGRATDRSREIGKFMWGDWASLRGKG